MSADELDDVSSDVLDEAAFVLSQEACHIGWSDQEREQEYMEIVEHLRSLADQQEARA